MNLKTFFEQANLDFRNLYFTQDTTTSYYSGYPIKPADFITFAKADFYKPDTQGLVNALSNAKRAIDCQADSFIDCIGLRADGIDKQLGREGLTSVA